MSLLPLHEPARAGLRRLKLSAFATLAAGFLCAALAAEALVAQQGLAGAVLWQSLAVYAGIAAAVRLGLPAHLPRTQFGPANTVTLSRAVVVCLLAGLVGRVEPAALGWLIVAGATGALLLDGLDGWLARNRACASAFGARFDQEVDGLFVMVLSLLVWLDGQAGLWVLASGLWHYGFHAARLAVPLLRRPLPPSWRRKTVFVLQAVALIAALAPPLQGWPGTAAAAAGLGLLSASFLIDLVWLLRRTPDREVSHGETTT